MAPLPSSSSSLVNGVLPESDYGVKALLAADHSQKLPSMGGTSTPSPLLLYAHKRTQTLYSISPHNQKASLWRIPQFRHKKILDYTHGWFVLCDRNQPAMLSLYNLVTLDLINLPPLPAPSERVESMFVALNSPPDRDDSLFLFCNNVNCLLHWCSPAKRDCSWVTQPLEFDGERFRVYAAFTLHGGLFYVNVMSVDPRKESLYQVHVDVSNSLITFTPLLQVCLPCPDIIEKKCLVESCGHVYFVCLFFVNPCVGMDLEPRAIKVFELDFSQLLWREINSLNGRSFFLGCNSCTWCWGTTNVPELEIISGQGGILSNCVYFIIPAGEPGDIFSVYIYNLNDKSFMPLRSCPELLRPKDSPVWLIPQHLQGSSSMKERIKEVDHPHHGAVLKHDEGQQISLTELPQHMIECISKYMHLFEYWNFRASCKLFRSICPAPQWRTNNAPPLLMIFKDSNSGSGSCELIDPVRCDSRFSILPLSPYPFTVLFSNNGWLLTLVDKQYLEYFNLFTGARGKFPPFDCDFYFKCFAFSTYPTSPNCLTVGIDVANGGGVLIHILQSKRRQWGCHYDGREFIISNSVPLFHCGAFYFLGSEGYLGVFQVANGIPIWNIYDKPQTIKEFHSCYLVECQGKVYSIFMEMAGKWIQLFIFDESEMSWVEIKSLGNFSFFISRASSFATSDPRMRNRIYLPRFCGSKMIYYSLDTRKFHVWGSHIILEDLYGTTEPSSCCWM